MNHHENDHLRMLNSTKGVLDEHQASVDTVPKLASLSTLLGKGIIKIKDADKQFKKQSTPKGDVKEQAHHAVVVTAVAVAGSVYAYAKEKENEELKLKMDVHDTDFINIRDEDCITMLGNIYDAALKVSADLAPFGTTPDDIAAFRAEIDAFAAAKKSIGTNIAERSSSRTSLTESFAEADGLVEESIDRMMEGFRKKDIDFYNAYQTARKIWTTVGGHSKEETQNTSTTTTTTNAAPPASSGSASNSSLSTN
jgi:hypothetical protein